MLLLLGLDIYFLKLVFWCFKNLCLSFTFNFVPHFLLMLKTTYFFYLSRTVFTVRNGKTPYTHEIMIPLEMFSFMTGRSDWLHLLFCKDFWSVLHMAEVSPVGSNTSSAWLALPAAGRGAPFPVPFPVHPISSWGTENRIQSREPSWSWHRESSSSSLVSAVRVLPSWVEKEEKQVLVGLADSKQREVLCLWSMLHWHFALEGFSISFSM